MVEGTNYNNLSHSNLSFLLIQLLISYAYCYFFVKKLPKGIPRLSCLLLIFYTLFNVPWHFPSSILLRGTASFFLTWISSFKLALFAFDKGDLARCNNYFDFIALATFPLKIKFDSSTKYQRRLAKAIVALTLLIASSILFTTPSITSPILALLALYIFIVCLTCLRPHLEVITILNQPYKATSLQDFWGKRWNRVSSDILRHTIYNPTRELTKSYIDDGLAKVVALIVTLSVSGIMHEIMFYHMSCGKNPTWKVTRFFAIQGVSIALEIAIKRYWIRKFSRSPSHRSISVLLTLTFVLVTSYFLLVLPVLRISENDCGRDLGRALVRD